MTGSPFITVTDPQANMGSIIAAVNALKFNVNILIVNAQAKGQTPNLAGANVFAKINALETKLTGALNQINALNEQVATLKTDIIVINGKLSRHGIT